MEKQPLSISTQINQRSVHPGHRDCKCTQCGCKTSTPKITQTMPDTSIDNPGRDVHYPYNEESKQERKAEKAKKKLYNKRRFKKNVPINHNKKLQWLKGEGPQTD